jgi:hypothetical protein
VPAVFLWTVGRHHVVEGLQLKIDRQLAQLDNFANTAANWQSPTARCWQLPSSLASRRVPRIPSFYPVISGGDSGLLSTAVGDAGVSERSGRLLLDPVAERRLFDIGFWCGAPTAAKFKRRMRFNSLTV